MPSSETAAKRAATQAKWDTEAAEAKATAKVARRSARKTAFKNAAAYADEYKTTAAQEARLTRQARDLGNFYVPETARLLCVVRIRGINDLHPKSRKILWGAAVDTARVVSHNVKAMYVQRLAFWILSRVSNKPACPVADTPYPRHADTPYPTRARSGCGCGRLTAWSLLAGTCRAWTSSAHFRCSEAWSLCGARSCSQRFWWAPSLRCGCCRAGWLPVARRLGPRCRGVRTPLPPPPLPPASRRRPAS
eukprot:COSAG01_NODE_15105_length_1374_cov_0.982745_2_plen_249_part_00